MFETGALYGDGEILGVQQTGQGVRLDSLSGEQQDLHLSLGGGRDGQVARQVLRQRSLIQIQVIIL